MIEHIEDRNYEEWSRAAYIALAVSNDQSKTVADCIGERPYHKRQRLKAEEQANLSDDELRVIAMNKGLNPF